MTGPLRIIPYCFDSGLDVGSWRRFAVEDALVEELPAALVHPCGAPGWSLVHASLSELAQASSALDAEARGLRQRVAQRREPRTFRRAGAQLRIGPERCVVMGILNVTPDSFSDGGRFYAAERAVERGLQMVGEGADIVDVGGESTRPGAGPVPPEEEHRRVLPVVEELVASGAAVSVDTRRPGLAQECLEAGALVVNDVTGLRDAAMRRVVGQAQAPAVMMHMRGEPRTMQQDPRFGDVVVEVVSELEQRASVCEDDGIPRQRLIFDPGLGFGKRTGQGVEDNLVLVAGLRSFDALGMPAAVGASRKRFLGSLTGRDTPDRQAASIGAALAARARGADLLRVHDVAATRDALWVWEATREAAAAGND